MAEIESVEKDEQFWKLVSKYRRESREGMLEAFEGTARNSSEIAEVLGITTGAARHYIKQAEREGLVECVTPNSQKFKMYSLTEIGQEILEEVL